MRLPDGRAPRCALHRLSAFLGAALVTLALSEYPFFNEEPALALAEASGLPPVLSTLVPMVLWYLAGAVGLSASFSIFQVSGWPACALAGALYGRGIEAGIVAGPMRPYRSHFSGQPWAGTCRSRSVWASSCCPQRCSADGRSV